jgi:hypothetical protein
VHVDSRRTTWEDQHYGSHGDKLAVRASTYRTGERGNAATPPSQIIPQPRHYQLPTRDVSIAGGLSHQHKVTESRYGYCDPVSGDIDMRKADGTPSLQTQSMRAVFTHEVSMDCQSQSTVKHFSGIPIPRSPGK